MQHVKLCLSLLILITACDDIVTQSEPLKNALFIYICRKDDVKSCEDSLKKSCKDPISSTRTEDKDQGTVTITVECKQHEEDISPSPTSSK